MNATVTSARPPEKGLDCGGRSAAYSSRLSCSATSTDLFSACSSRRFSNSTAGPRPAMATWSSGFRRRTASASCFWPAHRSVGAKTGYLLSMAVWTAAHMAQPWSLQRAGLRSFAWCSPWANRDLSGSARSLERMVPTPRACARHRHIQCRRQPRGDPHADARAPDRLAMGWQSASSLPVAKNSFGWLPGSSFTAATRAPAAEAGGARLHRVGSRSRRKNPFPGDGC